MLEAKRPSIYLQWVNESINQIKEYLKDLHSFEEFKNDKKTIDAVLMQLIHIGELINKFHKKYADTYDLDIPYNNIIWFRNFAAHDYFGINLTIVRKIVKQELPKLQKEIKEFLDKNI